MKPKRAVLATIANKGYLDYAKQVFCGAKKTGWSGDFLLLTDESNTEEDLAWFRKHHIIVWVCPDYIPLDEWKAYPSYRVGYPVILLHKFYLFSQEIKKWDHVIYMDTDIIPARSLHWLTKQTGFLACMDMGDVRIIKHLLRPPEEASEILKADGYNPDYFSFNSGIFAFSTDVVKSGFDERIRALFKKYGLLNCFGDQLIFNLLFYEQWKTLSPGYNFYPEIMKGFGQKAFFATILHFPAKKGLPWLKTSRFYPLWKSNYDYDIDIPPQKRNGFIQNVETFIFTSYWWFIPIGWKALATSRPLRPLYFKLRKLVNYIKNLFHRVY